MMSYSIRRSIMWDAKRVGCRLIIRDDKHLQSHDHLSHDQPLQTRDATTDVEPAKIHGLRTRLTGPIVIFSVSQMQKTLAWQQNITYVRKKTEHFRLRHLNTGQCTRPTTEHCRTEDDVKVFYAILKTRINIHSQRQNKICCHVTNLYLFTSHK